jgi:hypothetical protein
MRVIRLLQALSIALLMVPLIATAAGAIYIPGQEIPNDGLMHIMAADSDQEPGTAASPWATTGYLSGILPQASINMPALSLADIQKQIGGIRIPNADISGASVGSGISSFTQSGYLKSIDTDSLMANMPVVSVPSLF